MIYSHSYEDPETGEVVDVLIDEDDAEDYRNARPRGPRGGGRFAGRVFGRRPQQSRAEHQHGSGSVRPAPRPRSPQTLIVRDPTSVPRHPQQGPVQPMGYDAGEFFAIRKTVLADLLSAAGPIWASFLMAPEPPKAVGDDVVDRDNASMHRQALAQHDQNQTRILALTDLAARVAKLFL